MNGAAPHVSIVIPIYNEEGILRGSVLELQEKLRRFNWTYELLLCENGSRDRTVEIGKELEIEHPEVRLLRVGQPNYGLAMKMGILEARGEDPGLHGQAVVGAARRDHPHLGVLGLQLLADLHRAVARTVLAQ